MGSELKTVNRYSMPYSKPKGAATVTHSQGYPSHDPQQCASNRKISCPCPRSLPLCNHLTPVPQSLAVPFNGRTASGSVVPPNPLHHINLVALGLCF